MTNTDHNESAPPAVQPSGIGGWLILPLIGLLLSPVRMAILVIGEFKGAFQAGVWENLPPGLQGFIIAELGANLAVAAFGIVCLVLFLMKSKRTPKLMIAFYVAGAVVVFADVLIAAAVFGLKPQSDFLRNVASALVGLCIWVPYFRRSVRVANTFTD